MNKINTATAIPCSTCKKGALQPRKIARLGTPVAIFGYIVLIPSLFILIISLIGIIGAPAAGAGLTIQAEADYRDALKYGDLNPSEIEAAINQELNLENLTTFQRDVYQRATDDYTTATADAAATAGVGILAGMFSIIPAGFFTLLGFILTMRKRILQCSYCNVVQAAS